MIRFLKSLLILCSVLSLTAFSCSKKKSIGDPYILYKVIGTVTGDVMVPDETTADPDDFVYEKRPIRGIKVSATNSEVVYTSSDGGFVFEGRSALTSDESLEVESVYISFEDVDLKDNGGPYLKKTQRVDVRRRDPGDDRNYKGYYFASGVEVEVLQRDMELEPLPPDGGIER